MFNFSRCIIFPHAHILISYLSYEFNVVVLVCVQACVCVQMTLLPYNHSIIKIHSSPLPCNKYNYLWTEVPQKFLTLTLKNKHVPLWKFIQIQVRTIYSENCKLSDIRKSLFLQQPHMGCVPNPQLSLGGSTASSPLINTPIQAAAPSGPQTLFPYHSELAQGWDQTQHTRSLCLEFWTQLRLTPLTKITI